MKAIVPVAGIGTRLRPHTHTQAKVLLQVAGKEILGHILDELIELGIDSVTFIVGYMGERIQEYVDSTYHLKATYVNQEETKGLGHAIWLAKEHHWNDKEVLIILGDTIFKADFASIFDKPESYIGVKEVSDPRRFGIVEIEKGFVRRLVEKPEQSQTNLAIVGIYMIRNPKLLFRSLDEIIGKDITTKGEYQLTDALQLMIEKGEKMKTFLIEGWYDCGKPETLLQTNRELLTLKYGSEGQEYSQYRGSIINTPVSIAPTARIENSIVGPYVTISEDAVIQTAIVTNAIISKQATVKNIVIENSIIGDNAKAIGRLYTLNVGDSSEVNFE
jgi:glucose-1-phosphate thymidylyltransferase